LLKKKGCEDVNISSLLSGYTNYYSSGSYASASSSRLTTSLDTNHDDAWSYEEVSEYASDYKSVTGKTLDVDAIFDAYDADGDNSLTIGEQAAVTGDDALNLNALAGTFSSESSESDSLLGEILSDTDSATSYLMSALRSESNSLLLQYTIGIGSDDDSASIAEQAEKFWIAKNSDSSDASSSALSRFLSSYDSGTSSILDLLA
jgi:hypothetical protein